MSCWSGTGILLFGLHPDLQVEELLLYAGKFFHIDPFSVLPGQAVEGHLRHRIQGVILPRSADDLFRDIPGVHAFARDRPEIDHRGLREVEVPVPYAARVHDQSAFGIRDLTVREVFRRARVPCIVRDLALAVVVAERDVIEPSERIVLSSSCSATVASRLSLIAVARPWVTSTLWCPRSDLDLVIRRPVILDPEHVGDEVEDCVANLDLLVPESVCGCDPGRVVGEDFEGRGGVPGLDHAVVPGDHDERDPCGVEPFERFEHGCVGRSSVLRYRRGRRHGRGRPVFG